MHQTVLTLFYSCLSGNAGLAKVERGLLGTEGTHSQGHFLAASLS